MAVTHWGTLFLDGEVTSLPELVVKLSDALRTTGGKRVVFDLAEGADEGAVRSAIDAAKRAGASRFEIKKPVR